MDAITHTSTLQESAIIERVARIVFSVRGAKADYTRLAAELEQAIPFDVFGVVLLMHDRKAVRVTVCQRAGGVWLAKYHQHPLSDSKLEQVLQHPQLLVKDYPEGLDGAPAMSGDALSGCHQLRSTLIAPLIVEERVLGTLELGSTVCSIYTDENLQRLVTAVVRVLATAIESAQLGGNAAIQDRQRAVLTDVTRALNAKMDLSVILNKIVDGIADALRVASCIVLLGGRTHRLCLEAQSGLNQVALDSIFKYSELLVQDNCIIGQTLLQRRPLVSQDISTDERFPASSVFFTAMGVRSIYCYPLLTGATLYGALLLCSPEAGGFTPLKGDILALFANQATVAIHNGMLLESVHQRSRFQAAVEQLEIAQKHASAGSGQDSLQGELALFENMRDETQRTLGVSLTSLLLFISEHLLTQNERNLQAIFYAEQNTDTLEMVNLRQNVNSVTERIQKSALKDTPGSQQHDNPFASVLTLLEQSADLALTRAGTLGELSRLLMQLKQSSNRIKDPWIVVDLDGFCTYMNPAAETFCEYFSIPMSAAYRHQLFMTPSSQGSNTLLKIENVFVKMKPRVRNVQELERYLQGFTQGRSHPQELRCVLAVEPLYAQLGAQGNESRQALHPDGFPSDYHYQFTRYPLYDQQGQLEATALQIHDVTEQVRDEKNMLVLLSAVSHDLRTPLTTIKGAVTGLLQTEVVWSELDRQGMLEDIDSEADNLTALVSALVELSRIEMGALILEKEWCDCVEVIHGALFKLKRVLTGHAVRIQFASPLPLVYADHVQLERVFYHLLENAARHSPAQSEILVSIDSPALEPGRVRFQVIDHGIAIPEEERTRVFKSFYSLKVYGNVMGLAICRGIIEAHQGTISVEPAPEAGSCFIFTLPLHVPA